MQRHLLATATPFFLSLVLLTACGSDGGSDLTGENDSTTTDSAALSSGVSVGETLATTANLNLRSGPSTAHGIITVIPDGAHVTVVSATHSGGFYNVKYNGHTGWSSGLYLKTVSTGGGTGGGEAPSAAVNRALEWVHAGMPYCGGENRGHDYICGGTCERNGAANNAAWNPFRSDCSGLISFAWGLPAPGRVTSGFAPYNGGVSYVINAAALQPGDALNSVPDEHIILFAGWENRAQGKAHIIEELNCGHVAMDSVLTLEINGTSVYIPDLSPHSYRSIRHR